MQKNPQYFVGALAERVVNQGTACALHFLPRTHFCFLPQQPKIKKRNPNTSKSKFPPVLREIPHV